MKITISISLLLFFAIDTTNITNAQTTIQKCLTTEIVNRKIAQNPAMGVAIEKTFEAAKAHMRQMKATDSLPVYRIPVVVHIVYTQPAENLPDSIIYNQIEVLNEDYRRQNRDTGLTRSIFKPFAADAHIEFYLARKDPDGNPSTGITRTQGNPSGILGFTPFSDNVKFDSTGGISAWPTDRYLNIWVCNIMYGLGVLGYSYPPASAPNWPPGSTPMDANVQGVVIHYSVFGKNNPNAIGPFKIAALGRTVTHEVGHYLGLRHIWGDGDCTEDDGISDTPFAASDANFVCDYSKNTCTDTPIDFPDMIENFMDYNVDSCMNMFTQEQVNLMRSMLETARSHLYTIEEDTTTTAGIDHPTGMDYPMAMNVFPNPSPGYLYIDFRHIHKKIYSIELCNIIGRVVIQINNPDKHGGLIHLDLSDFADGIYLVKLATAENLYSQKVFLQQ